LLRTGSGWCWWPTAGFAAVAAVSKLPFFMAAGLCAIFLLLLTGPRSVRRWLLLASAGGVAVVAFAAWSRHAEALAAQAEYPYLDLRMSHSPFIVFWFFGDWHYRLNPFNWLKGGWRFLHATVGTLPMVALLVPPLFRRGEQFAKFWLLGALLTTLIFTHLVLAHWHYYLMCCPAVALLCGTTLARWEPFWISEIPTNCLRLAFAGIVLVFSAIEGMLAMKPAIDYDSFPKAMSALVREHTSPQDKLILYTCDPDWGALELLYSGRNGFAVATLESQPLTPTVKGLYDLLSNAADLSQLKQLGYNKLVLVSESPVRFAVEAINPGNKRERRFYPATISTSVDSWPVVYRSEDLLIKKIP